MIGSYPMILIASPQTTFRTPAELKVHAAKTPTFYASSGIGSPGHLSGELLVRALDTTITHVPYKGGSPSVLAVMSGEAQASFATLPAVVPQIRGGKVRAIGLASRSRNPAVPDVPTLIELGLADFDVGTWTGFVGPKGMPAEAVQKMNAAVAAVLALLRRKQRRFVAMVTLEQFCDRALVQEMAAAGCLGVAVGIESVDDDNCAAVCCRAMGSTVSLK